MMYLHAEHNNIEPLRPVLMTNVVLRLATGELVLVDAYALIETPVSHPLQTAIQEWDRM